MPQLFDMHCHLDFAEDAEAVASRSGSDIIAISSTCVPSSYVAARERFEAHPAVHVGLGIHPWWVATGKVGEVDVARFEALLAGERVVGEVGLDFSRAHRESKPHQMEVLSRVLAAIRAQGDGRLVFLHGVKGCHDLLNLLDGFGTCQGNACVFHWFSGTRDDFGRALAAGCLFSVNMRMLATDTGREYARAIPDERLLLETDSPAHEGMPWSAGAWRQEVENTARGLAEARGVDYAWMLGLLAENSAPLVSEFC